MNRYLLRRTALDRVHWAEPADGEGDGGGGGGPPAGEPPDEEDDDGFGETFDALMEAHEDDPPPRDDPPPKDPEEEEEDGDPGPADKDPAPKPPPAAGPTETETEKALRAELDSLRTFSETLTSQLAELQKARPPEKPAAASQPPSEEEDAELRELRETDPLLANVIDRRATALARQMARELLVETFGTEDFTALKEIPTATVQLRQQNEALQLQTAVMAGYQDGDKWLDGHPDFPRIAASPHFLEWTKQKLAADGAYFDGGPGKVIQRVTEYKAEVARTSAASHDAEQRRRAEELRKAASGELRGGTRTGASGKETSDPDDFDGAFDEAVEELEKKERRR